MQLGRPAGQSVGARHPTHSPLVASHTGESPLHPFTVQLVVHLSELVQRGVAGGQSVLVRHWAQVPVPSEHAGAAAPQLELATQATQRLRTGSHSGVAVPAQVMSVRHPTHCPVIPSQMEASLGHDVAVQAAWQT